MSASATRRARRRPWACQVPGPPPINLWQWRGEAPRSLLLLLACSTVAAYMSSLPARETSGLSFASYADDHLLHPNRTQHLARHIRRSARPFTTGVKTQSPVMVLSEDSDYDDADAEQARQPLLPSVPEHDDESPSGNTVGGGGSATGERQVSAATGNESVASQAASNSNEAEDIGFVRAFLSHIDKQWKFAEVILIIVISAILNLVTIIGNIMVLISFKMDRSLQTVSNYFLLSLALADLLIGLISMPLYTLYLLLNYWPLGPLMCDIWLAIDYLNSNAAVLNMLIISFDRYFSVTRPLTYRAKRTTKHACLMISCAWILSLTIWTPAIFTYPYYKGRTVQGTDKCEIEFVKANTYLTFVTAILAFYIPVIIMIYLYWRIWLETKKRYRDLTTLFLVSGVGAAAPARSTRPTLVNNSSTNPAAINSSQASKQQQAASRQVQRNPSIVGAGHGQPAAISRKSPINDGPNSATRQAASSLETSKKKYQSSDNGNNSNQMAASKIVTPTSPSISSRQTIKQFAEHDVKQSHHLGSPNPDGDSEDQLFVISNNTNRQCQAKRGAVSCCCGSLVPTRPSSGAAHNHQHHYHHHSLSNCRAKMRKLPKTSSTAKFKQTSCGCNFQELDVGRVQQASSTSPPCSCAPLNHSNHLSCGCHSRRLSVKRGTQNSGGDKETLINAENMSPPGSLKGLSRHRGHHHYHHHHHHPHGHRSSHHHHHHHQHKHQANRHYDTCKTGKHLQTLDELAGNLTGSKVSIISSGYQILSSNTNSLGCPTSTTRKIHPSVTNNNSEGQKQQAQNGDKSLSQSCASLLASQQSTISNAPVVSYANTMMRLANKPSKEGAKVTVDSATSPIEFSSSPRSDDDGFREDCETVIASTGKKFIFESNDPKLVSQDTNKSHQTPLPPAKHNLIPTDDEIAAALHESSCKQCKTNWPPVYQRSPSVVQINKRSSNGKCCSAVVLAHDADCRVCYPRSELHQKKTIMKSVSSPRSHHCSECRSVAKSALAQKKSSICDQHSQQHAASPLPAESTSDQNKDPIHKLPILSAIQRGASSDAQVVQQPLVKSSMQRSSMGGTSQQYSSAGSSADRSVPKRAKKFSQKLTFSDILIEQSNSNQLSPIGQLSSGTAGHGNKESGQRLSARFSDGSQYYNNQRSSSWSRSSYYPNWLKRLLGSRGSGGDASTSGNKSSNILQTICCTRSLSPTKRFSSNESYPHKNSSSEDSEAFSQLNNNGGSGGGSSKPCYSSHHPIQPKSERKAAKTLSTLLLVFIVTWLPYNILVLIKTLSGDEGQVPEKIWNFSYYLCYINSTINPLCYALCNAQFRRTYMRILKCKLSNDHSSTRRLVPIQSSTWNKDLRASSDACSTNNPATITTSNNGSNSLRSNR